MSKDIGGSTVFDAEDTYDIYTDESPEPTPPGPSLPDITASDDNKILAVAPNLTATPTAEIIAPAQESTYVVADEQGSLSDVDVSKFVRGGLIRVTVNEDEYLTLAYGEGENSGFKVATSVGYIDCWTEDGTDLFWDITPAPDSDTTINIKVEAVDYPLAAQWQNRTWKYVFTGHIGVYSDGAYPVELDEPEFATEACLLYPCAFIIDVGGSYLVLTNAGGSGSIESGYVSFESSTGLPILWLWDLFYDETNNQWYLHDKHITLETIMVNVGYSIALGYYISTTVPANLDFSALLSCATSSGAFRPMRLKLSNEYFPLTGYKSDGANSEIYFTGPHDDNGSIVMRHFIVKEDEVTFTDTALGS